MVNKEMKFLDNGDIRYEIVDEAARSNIQTINTVLDTKADTSNVTALDTRVTGVEDDCYNSYAVGTASGTVASFSDGANDLPIKSLVIDINPVQDLHGYDSPWVAGGGKNLLNASTDSNSSNGVTYTKNENGTYTINGTANGTSSFVVGSIELVANTQYILSGCPSGGSGTTYNARIRDDSYVALGFDVGTGATITPSETKTYYYQITVVSGASVSNIVFKPMIRLASITDDTYAPYENICPISGWTGAKVVASGKNVFGGNALKESVLANIPNSTSGTDANGDYVSFMAPDAYNKKLFTTFKPNTQYTLIIRLAKNNTYTSTNIQVIYTDNTYAYLTRTGTSPYTPETVVFTTPVGKSIKYICGGYQSAGTYLYYDQCGVFEGVLTADDFEPYNGQTISINWESEAGTVYGGHLDVINGVLTIEKATVILNGTGVTWTYSEDSITGRCRCYTTIFSSNIKPSSTIISDRLVSDDSSRAFPLPWCVTSNVYSTVLIGVDERISSATDFNSWLSENPITLCYELRTPITIQLTPHQVNSLYGTNNIFADTGDINVEYKADTTLYIERLIESNVDRAEEAKIDAQNSATQAEQSASQALTYKTDTESARDEAQSIVNSISANASQIDTNTENITSLEEDRYKPYVTDSTSGAIASFTDGADDLPLKSLVVNIDPVQDLHGYDSPWVGGTGVNLLKPVETTVTSNGIVATGYEDGKVTVTGTATSDVQVELFLVSVAERRYYLILKDDINGSADTWWVSISGVAPIYSGHVNSTNFYSAGNYKLRINVKSGITINQTFYPMVAESETTYVPYENICPISGWIGANISRTGVNLLGGLPLAQSIYDVAYKTTAKIDTENHTVEFTRGTQHEDGSYRGIIFDKFKPDKQYTFIFSASQNTAGTNNSIRIVYSDGSTYAVTIKSTDKMVYTTYRYTTPVGKSVAYIALDYFGSTLTTLYCDKCGIFEGVISVDDFKPYSGQTIPIDWQSEARTVYGGKLDVLTGVLTVDRKYMKFDGSEDEVWYTYSTTGYRVPMTGIGLSGSGICNLAPTVSSASSYGVMFNASANYIYFFQTVSKWGVATIADLRLWLATNNIEVCYELATPLTIQLTPHEVKSLLGQNNIFADTGDSAVEYRADTKLYIERLTAPDSADMIADSNIISGQYFMVSNALYKATANIANGGQIIVGTNCTKVSLATALNEINA